MRALFILFVMLILAWQVEAKPRAKAKKKPPPARKPQTQAVIKTSPTDIRFKGLRLKGRLKKPDLAYIYKRKGLRGEQIVNVPENFNNEIIQGAGQF